jgi:hypothetical protein
MTLQGFFKKGIDMSIFKKKPPIEVFCEIKPPKLDIPEVIKKSKIRPTKCKYCLSIYQAEHKHIKHERDIGYLHEHYNLFVQCPICSNFNEVEFEEAEK